MGRTLTVIHPNSKNRTQSPTMTNIDAPTMNLDSHSCNVASANTPLAETSADCHVDTLPDDLLLHCFRFLPVSDLFTTKNVCSHWRELANDNHLWVETFKENSTNWSTIGDDKGIFQVASVEDVTNGSPTSTRAKAGQSMCKLYVDHDNVMKDTCVRSIKTCTKEENLTRRAPSKLDSVYRTVAETASNRVPWGLGSSADPIQICANVLCERTKYHHIMAEQLQDLSMAQGLGGFGGGWQGHVDNVVEGTSVYYQVLPVYRTPLMSMVYQRESWLAAAKAYHGFVFALDTTDFEQDCESEAVKEVIRTLNNLDIMGETKPVLVFLYQDSAQSDVAQQSAVVNAARALDLSSMKRPWKIQVATRDPADDGVSLGMLWLYEALRRTLSRTKAQSYEGIMTNLKTRPTTTIHGMFRNLTAHAKSILTPHPWGGCRH
eukprot:GFYU01000068.1.p1 GENE.GFYU01000068.1~~GFYU01000068.1.p1  ORF type:complete len:433 (-),score=41.52 GFYU01000068.1:167-1465(-)